MTYNMDEKDRKILDILAEHGEYTTRKIAKKTLLPTTTIHNRIKRLKKEKIIKKFTVDIDHEKAGKGFLAYILVSVNLPILRKMRKSQYDIANEIKRLYFVERADIVSGGPDIVVIIRVKDVKEFDKVLLGRLQIIDGIEKTQSLIVIHEE